MDAVRFEKLARAGRRLHAQARPAEAAATLREALSLWRGPALADVREAPFAGVEAERLERARLAALGDRIEADLALGADPDPVVSLALPEPGSTVRQARACAAIQLFYDRAAAVRPGFAAGGGTPDGGGRDLPPSGRPASGDRTGRGTVGSSPKPVRRGACSRITVLMWAAALWRRREVGIGRAGPLSTGDRPAGLCGYRTS
ncbi:BTAD domain-containing putative transcriptional regulator [Streptomyces sp. NPDC057963]|uniref:BTAD domain-containing putative transcriptional regulator n=1 Tax=Streptomyces sp. NPDC057963 TaxID=3346290 RepID=UPI0036E99451